MICPVWCWLISKSEAAAWAGAIPALTAGVSNEAFASGVVEVLRYPTAAGEPTDVLLRSLTARFQDVMELKSGKLDDALAWVAKTYPALRPQLDSPPERPPPVRPAL
jgi:hypothetical protein